MSSLFVGLLAIVFAQNATKDVQSAFLFYPRDLRSHLALPPPEPPTPLPPQPPSPHWLPSF
ncbi:MAG: hypothetical protein AB1938_14395 [Myxococcota bacterium]